MDQHVQNLSYSKQITCLDLDMPGGDVAGGDPLVFLGLIVGGAQTAEAGWPGEVDPVGIGGSHRGRRRRKPRIR